MTDKPIEETGARSRAGWFEAANIHGFHPTDKELHAGWNEWLSVNRAVVLQCPNDTKYQKNLRRLLIADCERGACVCRKTQIRAGGTYILGTDEDGQGFRHQTPERTATEYLIEASVFLSWLIEQGLSPSTHVKDWDIAVTTPAPSEHAATSAQVAGIGKKWTPKKLAELEAYRESHTMPETAKQFSISESRIRALLPRNKPKAKPFGALIHRMK